MQPALAHLTLGEGLRLVSVLVWVGSGALLLLRARPTRMTVLAGCMLLANGVSVPTQRVTDGTSAAPLGRLLLAVALTLAVLTISVFPDGHFRPSWLRWVAVAFGAWQILAAAVGHLGTTLDVLGGVVFFAGLGVPLVAHADQVKVNGSIKTSQRNTIKTHEEKQMPPDEGMGKRINALFVGML